MRSEGVGSAHLARVALGVGLLSLSGVEAHARTDAPALFCATYPDAPACSTGTVACTTCHSLSGPPVHNPYGSDVSEALESLGADEDFGTWLPEALIEVEALDSDGDGTDNISEIVAGQEPGWDSETEPECAEQVETDNDGWALGVYDHAFAHKRVMLDFCGRSPRYEERLAFAEADDPDAVLLDTLDLCLQSPYWAEILREMAIGMVEPIGPATDINVLGNWEWDLRLWQYVMSGDRDAGDIMQADYLVVESPAGSGILVPIDDPRNELEEYAQPLEAEYRYGIMTTRYALAMRIMFSAMPRNLTSHWYRKLLGFDMARSQGLYPIDEADGDYAWEAPLDVDSKGVWQQDCAFCHSTLDPLSYPWVRYNGIDLEGDTTGLWLDDRATDLVPEIDGYLMGEPVDGPEAWVTTAVASDAFAQTVVETFWMRVFTRAPYSCEAEEFDALWAAFRDEGRNVEEMLRQLIFTDAYGTP